MRKKLTSLKVFLIILPLFQTGSCKKSKVKKRKKTEKEQIHFGKTDKKE